MKKVFIVLLFFCFHIHATAQENFMTQSGLASKEDFNYETKSEEASKEEGIGVKDVLLSPLYAFMAVGYVAQTVVETAIMGTMIGVGKVGGMVKDAVTNEKNPQEHNETQKELLEVKENLN